MRSGKLVIAEGGPAAMIDQSLADAVLEAQLEVAVQVSSIGAAWMVRAHRSYSVDLLSRPCGKKPVGNFRAYWGGVRPKYSASQANDLP